MNGIVFTEFMEMVEKTWGIDMVDVVTPLSEGSYTCVGTYPHEELDSDCLKRVYELTRNLPCLAHGLIDGCAKQFKKDLNVARENRSVGGITKEQFTVYVQSL